MSDTIRDALAALVAAWDSEAYNREWGQRMTAAIAAARAALAAPAQGEPQDYDALVARLRATRMDRDNFPRMDSERWLPVGLAREAADAIAALRAERDDWKRKYGDANEWGLRNTAAWKDRAERAEAERDALRAECADLRRRLDEHIDDKERALRLSAKESTRLTTEVERLRERVRVLLGVVEAADEYHQYIHTTGDWSGLQGRHLFKAIDAARAKVQP